MPGRIGRSTPSLGSIGQLIGDMAGVAPNTGAVGEYLSTNVVVGSAVALTTATAKTVGTVSLTAGDWDIICVVHFIGATTTTVSQLEASISFSANTIDTTTNRFWQYLQASGSAIFTSGSTVPFSSAYMQQRSLLTSTTSVFMVASATFLTSTCSAFGHIAARRRR
jgi:hypothetical protein